MNRSFYKTKVATVLNYLWYPVPVNDNGQSDALRKIIGRRILFLDSVPLGFYGISGTSGMSGTSGVSGIAKTNKI